MKRILTMQDLSCVGQCSLTVALPVLSAYGIETCVLPTAVLSNHTMFDKWSYLDITPEINNIFEVWKHNGFKFDAFLLGYLGKAELTVLAEKCFDGFSADGAVKIIDPVFGDNGKLYGGFDINYVNAMKKLLKRADVILPNITEACFLTGIPYKTEHDEKYLSDLIGGLKKVTDGKIVVTGASLGGKIGEIIYENGETEIIMFEKVPESRHGTGDIFASVFTAEYLNGKSLKQSSAAASGFVISCLKNTDADHFYGVNFEKILNGQG